MLILLQAIVDFGEVLSIDLAGLSLQIAQVGLLLFIVRLPQAVSVLQILQLGLEVLCLPLVGGY